MANIDAIYSKRGNVAAVFNQSTPNTSVMAPTLTTAAADFTGVSANNQVAFTADATSGSFIQRLRFKCLTTTGVATCARIYLNNGGAQSVAANNSFYGEITLPAIAGAANNAAATPDIDYPMNFALPPGFRVLVGLTVTVAGGWVPVPICGDY